MLTDEEGKRRRFHDVTKIRDITSDMQGRNAPLRKNVSEESISDAKKQVNEKISLKETERYDYSKPFIQQVDDLMNGKIPKNDALTNRRNAGRAAEYRLQQSADDHQHGAY